MTLERVYLSGVLMRFFSRKLFHNRKKTSLIAHISGFGQGTEDALVYTIPEFVLSDGKRSFIIENLPVVILSKPQIGCDFIISETMVEKGDRLCLKGL